MDNSDQVLTVLSFYTIIHTWQRPQMTINLHAFVNS